MKKFLMTLLMIVMFFGLPLIPSFAVGTTTVGAVRTYFVQGVGWRKSITITFTADAANGAIASATIPIVTSGLQGWYFYTVEVDPGSTGPTAGYAITMKDTHGLDLCGGLLTSLSATATEIFDIGLGIPGFPVVTEDLTFASTGNLVNSATGTLILIFTAN